MNNNSRQLRVGLIPPLAVWAVLTLMTSASAVAQNGDDVVNPAESGAGGMSAISSPRPRRLGDSLNVDGNQEWRPGATPLSRPSSGLSLLDEQLKQARDALASGNIMASNQGALAIFQKVLALDPGNEKATKGIAQAANALAARARNRYRSGDSVATTENLSNLRLVDPAHPAIEEISQQLLLDHQTQELAAAAALAIERKQLIGVDGAVEIYHQLLALKPGSEAANSGLIVVEQHLVGRAAELTQQGQFEEARDVLTQAASVRGDPDEMVVTQQVSTDGAERAFFNARVDEVESLIDLGHFDQAQSRLLELSDSGNVQSLDSLKQDIERGRMVLAYVPGTKLDRDQIHLAGLSPEELEIPEMIVLPGGSFAMGSPATELARQSREGPAQDIDFAVPFAMSETEVTVAQFRTFVEQTQYVTDAESLGESLVFDDSAGATLKRPGVNWRMDYRGRKAKSSLPVVHVSWNDAVAYARWLSEKSGESYRLPSEAEFEYALRAGTRSPYWWGDGSPDNTVENLTGDRDRLDDLRWPVGFERYGDKHWGPAPVGGFAANPFQLFDMGGNVSEWVGDCYQNQLSDVPQDGSAQQQSDCQQRVVRGASWASRPELARSASRMAAGADLASCLVGFRVVKDLWLGRVGGSA